METAEKQSRNLSHKSFLIILKYIPYFIAFGYAISTLGDFFEYDLIGLGYVCNVSLLSWLFMLLTSFIFKYCYIHRLPLYYVILNDILNITDYYIGIPISVRSFLVLHLLVIFTFMSLYIYGYVKNIKKSPRVVN
jgi:hypothetical protein